MTHCHRIQLAAALAFLTAGVPAHAEIVDIDWTAEDLFERRLQVAPGKFAEICGKLAKGRDIRWRFDADAPLNFNIHFHEGKTVTYPARQDDTASAEGRLAVSKEQDYCWMWTNKSARAAAVAVRLQR